MARKVAKHHEIKVVIERERLNQRTLLEVAAGTAAGGLKYELSSLFYRQIRVSLEGSSSLLPLIG